MRLVQTIGNMHISIPFEFNVPILRINYIRDEFYDSWQGFITNV